MLTLREDCREGVVLGRMGATVGREGGARDGTAEPRR